MVTIVWFKRDLRTVDHLPLKRASEMSDSVVPLYVIEPDYWALPDSSFRHYSFVCSSLFELRQRLKVLGNDLVVRQGEIIDVFTQLHSRLGIGKILAHQETGNDWTYKRDVEVIKWAQKSGIEFIQTPLNGTVRCLKNRDHWNQLHNNRMESELVAEPLFIKPLETPLNSGEIPTCRQNILFEGKIRGKVQRGGRESGLKTLDSFLEDRSGQYRSSISKPELAVTGCSRLSPHITWGTLSIREIFHRSYSTLDSLKESSDFKSKRRKQGIRAYISRLFWHCHFIQKLEDDPQIEYRCMHPAFEGMRDVANTQHLQAWLQGQTGYPIVDACMRSLQEKGWLNFRMRAMVVSFAAYNLWIDWRVLSPVLAQLFTDYEPGIHYSQLQMQSGVTGINAIRIYNPVKQSLDQDPEANFIRTYVPELSDLPLDLIHTPWAIEPMFQKEYLVRIGRDYPLPIVEGDSSMKKARLELAKVRKSLNFKSISREVFIKHGSRKKSLKKKKSKSPQKDSQSEQMELDFES